VPGLGRIIAPDLARTVATYSDDEVVVLIRAGIKRNNTSLLIMPTDSFSSMADSDLADVIAWLRGLKPEEETEIAQTSLGPLGRFLAINGTLRFSAEMPRDPAPLIVVPTATQALGDYLVKTRCSHCHALDEEREVGPGLKAPPVRPMAQSYDLAQFTQLLRTGRAIGDRELELMSEVSRDALSHLTDEEIVAIHAYLNAPVEPPAASASSQDTRSAAPAAVSVQ
jgi:mono/diheme cytochrome c family protein